MKIAKVSPTFKGSDNLKAENHRPVQSYQHSQRY